MLTTSGIRRAVLTHRKCGLDNIACCIYVLLPQQHPGKFEAQLGVRPALLPPQRQIQGSLVVLKRGNIVPEATFDIAKGFHAFMVEEGRRRI